MRKLRGGRRYFRSLQRWPESVTVTLGGDSWYDLWHCHPDFYGWSKRDGKARHAHLDALFKAFRRILAQVADKAEPCQVFVAINTKDSPGDALYVHTPNPNEDNFPFDFAGYRWHGFGVPRCLQEFVDPDRFELGETVFEGEKRYVVTPRGPRGRPTKSEPVDATEPRSLAG